MDETVLLVVITEQGENSNQYEKQRNIFGFPPVLPAAERREAEQSEADRSVAAGRTVAPATTGPGGGRRRQSAEPSPPNTNCACWLRPTPPPLNPAPSVPCCGAMIAMTS